MKQRTLYITISVIAGILLIGTTVYIIQHRKVLPKPDQAKNHVLAGFKGYTSPDHIYFIQYPFFFSLAINQPYPPAPAANLKATVLTFPQSYFPGTSIQDASVSVLTTADTCSQPIAGERANLQQLGTIKNKQGIAFLGTQSQESGTGNTWQVIDYAAPSQSKCIHMSLFVHTTSPGLATTTQAGIKKIGDKNSLVISRMVTLTQQLVRMMEL